MIYMDTYGRVGNQLFYYAFARKIMKTLERERESRLSLSFKDGDYNEDYLKEFNVVSYETRDTFWNQELQKCTNKFQKILLSLAANRLNKASNNKTTCFLLSHIQQFGGYFYHGQYVDFKKPPFKFRKPSRFIKDVYVSGNFEWSGWFDDIRGVLLDEITPKKPELDHNADLYCKIRNTNSVCISIRLGDFLDEIHKNMYYVCNEDYFIEAIKKMREKVDNPTWFVFSDDIQWAKDSGLFTGDDKVYYERGDDPVWEKLRLMYSCKHFIISNSTFSWWAQYLSRNEDKVVVSPDVWFNPGIKHALIEDSFVKVNIAELKN